MERLPVKPHGRLAPRPLGANQPAAAEHATTPPEHTRIAVDRELAEGGEPSGGDPIAAPLERPSGVQAKPLPAKDQEQDEEHARAKLRTPRPPPQAPALGAEVGAPASEPRAVDVFLKHLKAEGAQVVFGIPGGLLHPFFDAVEHDADLGLIVSKHEEGAAFMADGYARVCGRLAVCAGTSGPGATNLLTGVACAYADGVPMLVVTGQAASAALGKGAAQETNREDIDIVEMFRPVTKYSTMVTSADSLPHHVRRALRHALTGRRGPVHLNVPVDLWAQQLAYELDEHWYKPSSYRPTTTFFDRVAVQRAARTLLRAQYPVVLAGAGVGIAGAEQHLRTLAELLPARVATTPRGKGLFPEDHHLSLGVLGFAGHRDARETILGDLPDVLFTVGASLNETTTLNWSPRLRPSVALIQLDLDMERIGRNYPVDTALVGDAQTILVELVYHVHRLLREHGVAGSKWKEAAPLARGHERFSEPEQRVSDRIPVSPQRWRVELQEVLPQNAIVFSDIGGHMLTNVHHLCIRKHQKFVLNLGFGSMGHGTAAPIGAALAAPKRPVFAIIGDACFAMNGMELLTASDNEIPVIWIVENNNMHGITWHGSQMVGSKRPLNSVRNRRSLEVAAIARAMGLYSEIVNAPGQIGDIVTRALASRRPALIEVRVDAAAPPPLGDRARSISGFIKR
ncbi:MAG: thiamine pyrophosphate-dependent enzyme [Proteobacteria bacterium]|nr:thiamine pyrophosphate-dependent enzyme [Pseudomonadota bacterium]